MEPYLVVVNKIKREKVGDYVKNNPSLKSIPNYCPEVFDEIDVNTSDEKLNEILFRHKGFAELKINRDTEKMLKTQYDSISEIEKECEQLSAKIQDFQKDDLVQYLIKRKKIIDLLEKKLKLKEDGKHQLESIIHDILFPRNTSTNQLPYENHNLWIIDDTLSYHQYAISDPTLSGISNSASGLRPDIIIFEDVDDNSIANSVSIIELKRPQREAYDKSPIDQMYEIIDKIKNKRIKQENGRDINVDDSTKFYCFAICDINDFVKKDAERRDFNKLKGSIGYYNYNKSLNAYTEILAYDKLVSNTKKRHRAFFEKLGIR